MANFKFNLRGAVIDKNDKPASGLLIRGIFSFSSSQKFLFGPVFTDEKGRYSIKITEEYSGIYRRVPDAVISISAHTANGGLLYESKETWNGKSSQTINLNLNNHSSENETKEEKQFTISGKVVTSRGEAIPDVIVEVIEQGLPGSPSFDGITGGPVITREDGSYKIRMSCQDTDGRDTRSIYFIKVSDKSGKTIHTTTLYNAREKEKFNLIVPENAYQEDSEFEKLLRAITKHLNGVKIEDIRETDREKGITFLARKTQWDARLIAMAVLAHKYDQKNRGKIPKEFYYVLFRAGVPSTEDQLYRINADKAVELYKSAVKKNIIPQSTARAEEIKKAFIEIGKQYIRKSKSIQSISEMDEMLSLSLNKESDREKFAELYYHKSKDIKEFWKKAEEEFGAQITGQLKLDGKLGFLTFNNAPLIAKLKQNKDVKTDPIELIKSGYYKEERWDSVIDQSVSVPELFGKDDNEKRTNYIKWLTGQLKISYPSAVVAERLKNKEFKLPVKDSVLNEVYTMLNDQKEPFAIGKKAINQHIEEIEEKRGSKLADETKLVLKKLHRAYQLSPSDHAMTVLLEKNLDSAFKITRYSQKEFTDRFKNDFKGEEEVRLVYDKAAMDAATITNLTLSYLTQASNPLPATVAPMIRNSPEASVKRYPTIENLFGSLDYCTCGHCESVLSPAAYLVDLFQFLDLGDKEFDGANPIETLLNERRPDLEHLQLTCENTFTVLPYIDLVNEILEYYVVHPDINDPNSEIKHTLKDFEGYNIEGETDSFELLANPQYVNERAYEILKDAVFPVTLPFNRNLELLRQYFEHLEVPLHRVMKMFRENDKLEQAAPKYGWLDIMIEYLGMSPEEFEILTDHTSHTIQSLYGLNSGEQLNTKIPNAGEFCRRIETNKEKDLTRKELIEILNTRFINPPARLRPRLEKLQQVFNIGKENDPAIQEKYGSKSLFEILNDIKNGDAGTNNDFDAIFPPEEYEDTKFGGDLKVWIQQVHADVLNMIFLVPDNPVNGVCDFEQLKLRRADPNNPALKDMDYWKLIRFIRLWKKLGWTIEEADKAIFALYDYSSFDFTAGNISKMDEGFKDLLIKLSVLKWVTEELNIRGMGSFEKTLALFADIDTYGKNALYRRLFLRSSTPKTDDVFDEDDYGDFLAGVPGKVFDHKNILQAGCNINDDEWILITEDLGFTSNTGLTLSNVSKIFRYAYLSRSLKISINELIALKELSGIDPFEKLEYADDADNYTPPQILSFLKLVKKIKGSEFKVQDLKYLLQHVDETGKSGPGKEEVLNFYKVIHEELKKIDEEYPVGKELTEETARSLLSRIYGDEIASTFHAIIGESRIFTTDYDHNASDLDQTIKDADHRIGYDDFEKKLFYNDVMTGNAQVNLKTISGVSQAFQAAIDDLYNQGQKEFERFFKAHPELSAIYESHGSFDEVVNIHIKPLIKQLKQVQAGQILSTYLNSDIATVNSLLEEKIGNGATRFILNSNEDDDKPAVNDFIAIAVNGISAKYFYSESLSGTPDKQEQAIDSLSFIKETNPLPQNPAGGSSKISAQWNFYVQAPASDFYNIYLETDNSAEVKLLVEGDEIALQKNESTWSNQEPIELRMGKFYAFEIRVSKVKDKAVLKWEARNGGGLIDSIPVQNLYPAVAVENFHNTYIRILKSLKIVEGLSLLPEELEYFSNDDDFKINNLAFLNKIPVNSGIHINTVRALFRRIIELVDFVEQKETLGVTDKSLIEILTDPEQTRGDGQLFIFKVTNWLEPNLLALINRFSGANAPDLLSVMNKLTDRELVIRIVEAMEIVKKTGVSAAELIAWSTVFPGADVITNSKNVFRTRHDERSWQDVIKPINDKMRKRQRDALVTYVLTMLKQDPLTSHIDTPDKLFEFFLIDVEMDPCMKTSRIKQAISSVQLFINRCLLNLETGIKPASIDTGQWEWMSRYRVWEANRKVFLYPENWLEPSLRTTKSPIFRELEGELLQSDINEDLATSALLNYLEKLDKIALLEVCGMCRENEDKIHVVARTSGANREYFHRSFNGTWSAWEKINLDIEDGPVIPVFWKERLFLFWTSVLQKGDDENQMENKSADDLATFSGRIKQKIEVNLCWSEYYNKKWQPKRTSDFDDPVVFDIDTENHPFQYSQLQISYYEEDNVLEIGISNKGKAVGEFNLYNKYSKPESYSPVLEKVNKRARSFSANEFLGMDYSGYLKEMRGEHRERYSVNEFKHNKIIGNSFYNKIDFSHKPWDSFRDPFFCQDHQYAFFVDLTPSTVPVPIYEEYGWEIMNGNIYDLNEILIRSEFELKNVDPKYSGNLTLNKLISTFPNSLEMSPILKESEAFEFEGSMIGITGDIRY